MGNTQSPPVIKTAAQYKQEREETIMLKAIEHYHECHRQIAKSFVKTGFVNVVCKAPDTMGEVMDMLEKDGFTVTPDEWGAHEITICMKGIGRTN